MNEAAAENSCGSLMEKMSMLARLNLITVMLVVLFFIPLLTGAFQSFSRQRIHRSLASLLDNVEFIAGLFISVYLTNGIFFKHEWPAYRKMYELIPQNLRSFLFGKDILTYIIFVPLILLLMLAVLRLLTTPLYSRVFIPLANRIYVSANTMEPFSKRILGALWSIPKAVFYVLVFTLLLNFYSYYFSSPQLSRLMNESEAYQTIYRNTVYPVLNSNLAKHIPVLVNDYFGRAEQGLGETDGSVAEQLAGRVAGKNIRVIEYFNGVTLDEAIKSSNEIDQTAQKLTAGSKSSRNKAHLIYRWVTENIRYDFEKAVKISQNPRGISSGAIVAYERRSGICFDYSCLYIAMCRANGLKVRLVTGLGYSGISWGDHAWNQVYIDEEDRWINVDTTFGTGGNYFDKADFSTDHKYAENQGEW